MYINILFSHIQKGKWGFAVDPNNMLDRSFHCSPTEAALTRMMYHNRMLVAYEHVEQLAAGLCALPFSTRSELLCELIVLLPDATDGIDVLLVCRSG